jgi:hypothetical protein
LGTTCFTGRTGPFGCVAPTVVPLAATWPLATSAARLARAASSAASSFCARVILTVTTLVVEIGVEVPAGVDVVVGRCVLGVVGAVAVVGLVVAVGVVETGVEPLVVVEGLVDEPDVLDPLPVDVVPDRGVVAPAVTVEELLAPADVPPVIGDVADPVGKACHNELVTFTTP